MILPILLAASAVGFQVTPMGQVEGTLFAPDVPMSGAVVYLVPVDSAGRSGGERPDTAIMDQQRLRFVPPVLVGTPGLAVDFRNGDPILHNVFSPPRPGRGFDLGTYGRAESRVRTFPEPGAYTILCHIHPEMVAYVIIVPTRIHTVSDERGRFRLSQIPAGIYQLHVWHPFVRPFSRRVAVRAGDDLKLDLELERSGRF